jgi:hypothetical protein
MVSNAHGSAASREAVLTVTDNRPPVAEITSPAGGAEYAGGQVLDFSGKASDPEDGALPPSAFTWRVDIHHDAHTHPLLGPVTGYPSGSLAIPAEGETSANVWIRVHLTVRDEDGLAHSVHADVLPVKSEVTLSTSPEGLTVLLDGSPFAAPHAFIGVAGMRRTLAAPSPQIAGGKTWEFVSWSDGGAAAHAIATPGRSAAYTAVFREAVGEPGAVHEAEDAAAMQGAEPRHVHAGFTGRAYVKYRTYRSWVEWEIVSAQAGPRTLEFRYAYGTPEGSALRVTVDGAVAAEADLPATGSWSSWSTIPVTVDLPAGATRVRARMRKGEYLLLDNLTVR